MTKVNQILSQWVADTVSSTKYLQEKGLNSDLLHRYVKSGWIERIGYGAYKKKFDKIDWQGGLYCLQNQIKLRIHPGGKTALELHGVTHNLPFKPKITLYGPSKEKLPRWFKNNFWKDELNYHSFDLFTMNINPFLQVHEYKNFFILISSPELAAFEILFHVPQQQSFSETIKIFENLTTLRFDIVQTLLSNCKSIKVNRIFLYLADISNHSWFKKIDISTVNLGYGKRVIEQNGRFDGKYNITVPKKNSYDTEPIY